MINSNVEKKMPRKSLGTVGSLNEKKKHLFENQTEISNQKDIERPATASLGKLNRSTV